MEAYGILAAITFFQYYLTILDMAIPLTTIRCFCNNMGILTNLKELQSQNITCPNDTTNDDHDIYLVITAMAKRCANISVHYLHVKGHQDKDPHHVLLTWEQHNIDCDHYARQHVLKQVVPSTTYGNPAFDTIAPHLQIDGKIICRKFLLALQEAADKPPYWNYLHKKHNWTHTDTLNIQWSALNLALHSLTCEDQ